MSGGYRGGSTIIRASCLAATGWKTSGTAKPKSDGKAGSVKLRQKKALVRKWKKDAAEKLLRSAEIAIASKIKREGRRPFVVEYRRGGI